VGGCASSSSGGSSSTSAVSSAPASSGAIQIKQDPMTSHMRSQVGTPNELSPLAPPESRNMRKVGDKWYCEVHGQPMVFNHAASCWEPHSK
jgi:hypothetical protein